MCCHLHKGKWQIKYTQALYRGQKQTLSQSTCALKNAQKIERVFRVFPHIHRHLLVDEKKTGKER